MFTDISEHRLEVAKQLGADYVVHVDTKDTKALAAKVEKILGCMPDITIECSGAESSIQTGIYVCTEHVQVSDFYHVRILCHLHTKQPPTRLLQCFSYQAVSRDFGKKRLGLPFDEKNLP